MQVIDVALGARSYQVYVGAGLLRDATLASTAGLAGASQAAIISNDIVAPLYGAALRGMLSPAPSAIHTLVLPDGEAHKDWQTLNRVYDFLLERGFDRQAVLYALGGGVIGDLAGFAAATFMRGIRFVQVPTTLLAMVDSSVGGKTAINHPRGKNMIGAFHQPSAVIADTDTLRSLPDRELRAGLAEVIKYGCIGDAEFFGWLEAHMPQLLAREPQALAQAIARCVQRKAAIVSADETEQGIRATLNFGHTFGHAVEAGLGYGVWLHGEAVAAGMMAAARLSERLGLVPADMPARLERLLRTAGLPVQLPRLPGADDCAGRYLELMRADKKAAAGRIRYIVLRGLGGAELKAVDDETVRKVLTSSLETA
jgi:3-dehydroquinate synthase